MNVGHVSFLCRIYDAFTCPFHLFFLLLKLNLSRYVTVGQIKFAWE